MTDLQKIQHQLEKAMKELNELDTDETQLAYDYIEYANILVKNLILLGVSRSKPSEEENNTVDYDQYDYINFVYEQNSVGIDKSLDL